MDTHLRTATKKKLQSPSPIMNRRESSSKRRKPFLQLRKPSDLSAKLKRRH